MPKTISSRKNVYSSNFHQIIKRGFDICISLVGIAVLIPVTIILLIVYRLEGNKGSLFFSQERIGYKGKKFRMWKYRSMVEDAERILEDDPKLYKKYKENSYKLLPEEDPRMTGSGRFIRKHSIDELPQFINILRGEMSFIGPRPVLEQELKEYGEEVDKFLSVKPGATGWWQVSCRSSVGYPERCKVELYYIDNYSLSLDLKIFFMEIKRIFSKDDAY